MICNKKYINCYQQHAALGSETLSQQAFPGESDPSFLTIWHKRQRDSKVIVYKINKPETNIRNVYFSEATQ